MDGGRSPFITGRIIGESGTSIHYGIPASGLACSAKEVENGSVLVGEKGSNERADRLFRSEREVCGRGEHRLLQLRRSLPPVFRALLETFGQDRIERTRRRGL